MFIYTSTQYYVEADKIGREIKHDRSHVAKVHQRLDILGSATATCKYVDNVDMQISLC